MKTQPELIVYAGPMFSGKTSALLMALERFKYQGRHVFPFKPKIDDRFQVGSIVSHMGWSLDAVQISTGKELIEAMLVQMDDLAVPAEKCVVAVDEMFMIPGVAEQLIWLYKRDITVVVSTLDLSHQCSPFDEVTKLLPWATKVKKFTSVCSVCHGDAHYTWRKAIDDEDRVIVIGGGELYEPRCKACHPSMT